MPLFVVRDGLDMVGIYVTCVTELVEVVKQDPKQVKSCIVRKRKEHQFQTFLWNIRASNTYSRKEPIQTLYLNTNPRITISRSRKARNRRKSSYD